MAWLFEISQHIARKEFFVVVVHDDIFSYGRYSDIDGESEHAVLWRLRWKHSLCKFVWKRSVAMREKFFRILDELEFLIAKAVLMRWCFLMKLTKLLWTLTLLWVYCIFNGIHFAHALRFQCQSAFWILIAPTVDIYSLTYHRTCKFNALSSFHRVICFDLQINLRRSSFFGKSNIFFLL